MGDGWPTSPEELAEVQRELAAAAWPRWRAPARPLRLGGCFCCHPRGLAGPGAAGDPLWAAATVVTDDVVVARKVVAATAGAPYLAGLLALRDAPALDAAVRALTVRPDVLLVDATGRDHPRRAGLALHLGAVLDLPTVGITHRPLLATGSWPANDAGAVSLLDLDGDQVAAWFRPRRGCRPLVVHAGWRTDVNTALAVARAAGTRYRTPTPLREARRLARRARTRNAC